MERTIRVNLKPTLLRFSILLIFALILRIQLGSTIKPDAYRHSSPSEYYLYVPKDYTPDKTYPLWVQIHSIGANGEIGCWNHLQRHADEYGFILLCPTLDSSNGYLEFDYGVSLLNPIINQVKQKYNVTDKIFLSGYSGGAHFVQLYANQYPTSISGLVLMSSNGYLDKSNSILRSIPILITVGETDRPRVLPAQTYYDSLIASGYHAEFVILDVVGHTLSQGAIKLALDQFSTVYP
jgi:predicted peptidase